MNLIALREDDDLDTPAVTAWQREWERYWRHGWERKGSKFIPSGLRSEGQCAQTILALERQINDGQQLSVVTPGKERT